MKMLASKIAIFSDAHGNALALQKAFELAEKNGAEEFIYLGDSIGYIPSTEALELLRLSTRKVTCIKGNHEDQILSFDYPKTSDDVKKHSVIKSIMTEEQLSFIATWPESAIIQWSNSKFLFVHGSPENPLNGYIYFDSEIKDHPSYKDYQLIFVGNTHIPFIRKLQNTSVINVGSVGLPRDHGKIASFAMLDLLEMNVKIIRYSISKIQDKIQTKYADSLNARVVEVFERISDVKVSEELSFG